jgi:hypothetical protein
MPQNLSLDAPRLGTRRMSTACTRTSIRSLCHAKRVRARYNTRKRSPANKIAILPLQTMPKTVEIVAVIVAMGRRMRVPFAARCAAVKE